MTTPANQPDSFDQRVHENSRLPDKEFGSDEPLYRRFDPQQHLVDGILSPLAFNFPRQSVNRGKYSVPDDVLHPDCCDGAVLSGWRVVTLRVGDIPDAMTSGDGREFRFFMRHTPKTRCYPHSEMWCNRIGPASEEYEPPPKKVREAFRTAIALRVHY